MTPLFGLILIVLIAYIGAVYFQKTKINSQILKGISHSGILFLILGYILGPNVFKILDEKIFDELSIILSFILGWTGFLIGLQINFKQMRRFQVSYYWAALSNFCLIFSLIAMGLFITITYLNVNLKFTQTILIITAASISSPLIVGIIRREYRLRGKIIHFLQFHSAYDNMLGVMIIGLVVAAFAATSTISGLFLTQLFKALLIVSFLSGLFYYVAKEIKTFQQNFLLIIGFLLMVVGTAIQLNQSALFISFIFGFILSNLPINTWKIFQMISSTEKTIYLLLLIFIGVNVSDLSSYIIAAGIIFSIFRIVAKYVSGSIVFTAFRNKHNLNKNNSLFGIGMSGLALALLLDYQMVNSSDDISIIFSIIAVTYLISDGMSLMISNPKLSKICD